MIMYTVGAFTDSGEPLGESDLTQEREGPSKRLHGKGIQRGGIRMGRW